jgi:aspartyl-tRNA(Asn)/glutamyl-tRNA(Gln) amidotransferase subunit A
VDGIWLARPPAAPEAARALGRESAGLPPPRRARPTGAGEPVAVKDLLDTAGLATTYGSALFADHVPTVSADAVQQLEAGGFAVAGKTNLHEFAYGISSQNAHYGTVPNPVAPGRLAGGSSGGSAAAIAAGEVELALGSDSAGSIRIPAAWCGIVGFKPTHGLVSVDGCFPLAPTYDVVGPMASSVEGCERLLRVLAPGFEPLELESLEELEVGVAWLDQTDSLVRERVGGAAALFPRRREIELPLAPSNRADFMREVAGVHRALFPGNEELYGDNVRGKIERCLRVTDDEAAAAERDRLEYRERVAEAVAGLDLLVTPTVPFVAPPVEVDELEIRAGAISLTYPFSSLGWPALALPCGPAEDGLPASVQLAAPAGEDARVLRAGRVLESLLIGRR